MDKDQIDKLLACMTARDERLQEFSEALANRDIIIEKQQESMSKLIERVETLTSVQQQQPTDAGNNGPGAANNRPQHVSLARSAENIRKDKMLNLYQNLQKCSDIKSYKHSLQLNV